MAKDPREYGYEGEMVMSQLKGIMNHANQMHDMLKPDTDLPEWVQSKVTLAYDYMQTAADYMATEMNEEIDKGLEDELMSQRQGQSGKNWRVTRANKTIGTYSSKDKADVKAMKHPLNKVVAEEEQIDELSSKTLFSYGKKARKEAEKRDEPMHRARGRLLASKKTNPARGGYKLTKVAATFGEEVAHSVHVKTYDSQGEKQMNSPEFKKHISAHGGKLDYASDKGAAFKFASHSHAAAFHRGVQSKFKELDSEHDVHEEVAVNAAGAGNVAGIGVGPQGEPGVHMKKKKKPVLARFSRFMKK
jgi:hypothetical protein